MEPCDFGCYVDSQCYSLGYRKKGEYCNDNRTFVLQIVDNEVCDSNFQCDSNLCIDGSCVSWKLLQKILNWFKGFF